jgi:hypothetical protein
MGWLGSCLLLGCSILGIPTCQPQSDQAELLQIETHEVRLNYTPGRAAVLLVQENERVIFKERFTALDRKSVV